MTPANKLSDPRIKYFYNFCTCYCKRKKIIFDRYTPDDLKTIIHEFTKRTMDRFINQVLFNAIDISDFAFIVESDRKISNIPGIMVLVTYEYENKRPEFLLVYHHASFGKISKQSIPVHMIHKFLGGLGL